MTTEQNLIERVRFLEERQTKLVEVLEIALGRLRGAYRDYSHPNFTDRYGDADRTKRVIDLVEEELSKNEPPKSQE